MCLILACLTVGECKNRSYIKTIKVSIRFPKQCLLMSHKSLNLILVWLQLTYTYQWLQPLLNAMLVWLNQSQLLAEHVITGCEKSEFTGGVKSSVPLLFFIMFVEPRLEQRKGPNCSYIKPIVLKKPHVKEVMRTPDGRYSIFNFCRPIIEYNTFV